MNTHPKILTIQPQQEVKRPRPRGTANLDAISETTTSHVQRVDTIRTPGDAA